MDIARWLQADEADRAAWVWRVRDRLLAQLWILVERSDRYWNRDDRDDWTTPELHYRYDLVREAMNARPLDHKRVIGAIADFLERIPESMAADMRKGRLRR